MQCQYVIPPRYAPPRLTTLSAAPSSHQDRILPLDLQDRFAPTGVSLRFLCKRGEHEISVCTRLHECSTHGHFQASRCAPLTTADGFMCYIHSTLDGLQSITGSHPTLD